MSRLHCSISTRRHALRCLALVALMVPLSAQTLPESRPDWWWNVWGDAIAVAGMATVQNGSELELVVANRDHWCFVRKDASGPGMTRVWQSRFDAEDPVTALTGGALLASGDGVVLGRASGAIEIWDAPSRRLVAKFSAGVGEVLGLGFADLDSAPGMELAVTGAKKLVVLDLSGKKLWELNDGPTNELRIGQLDADPGLEIATSNGYVVDSAQRSVQWLWNKSFGRDFRIADLDEDKRNEIVFLGDNGHLEAIDVARQVPLWSQRRLVNQQADVLHIADLDRDGRPEILVGSQSQSTPLVCYDGKSRQVEWVIYQSLGVPSEVLVADFDKDGYPEIVWGTGHRTDAADSLHLAESRTRNVIWSSIDLEGPFSRPVRGDVDGDRKPEVVVVSRSSEGSRKAGRILVFDGSDYRLRGMSAALSETADPELPMGIQLIDVDDDPELEILTNTGSIQVWDFAANGTFTRKRAILGPESIRSFLVADLDGQPGLELAMGTTEFLYLFDFDSQILLGTSFRLGEVRDIRLADVDFDKSAELLVLAEDGNQYVFDAKTGSPESALQPILGRKLVTSSLLPVPTLGEVPIGTDDRGNAYIYLPQSQQPHLRVGPIPTLSFEPFRSFEILTPDLFSVWARGGRMQFGYGPIPVWQSTKLDELGIHWSLQPASNRIRLLTSHSGGLIGFDF